MEEQHIYFMQQAIALAEQGKNKPDAGAFGAVIVLDGKVISAVHNLVKGAKDCTQHAEVGAVQKACALLETSNLSDCILYTSCEPCMMCLGACHWAGFKQIFFGASAQDAKDHGYLYSDVFYDSDTSKRHKEFNMQQLLRNEAVAVWK